jgi:hypothetical protein
MMPNPSKSSAPRLTPHGAKTPTDLKSDLSKGQFFPQFPITHKPSSHRNQSVVFRISLAKSQFLKPDPAAPGTEAENSICV